MKRSAPLKRGGPLKRGAPLKRGSGLKRSSGLQRRAPIKRTGRRPETAAHKRARLCFDAEVITERICFFADVTEAGDRRRPRHVCGGNDGELDAHHLIAKSWIQKHFGDLPEDELLAIKYAVILGCPLCRDAHDALPANLKPGDRVFFEELDDDLIEFVRWVDRRYKRRGRPSMEARLLVECPRREAIA